MIFIRFLPFSLFFLFYHLFHLTILHVSLNFNFLSKYLTNCMYVYEEIFFMFIIQCQDINHENDSNYLFSNTTKYTSIYLYT